MHWLRNRWMQAIKFMHFPEVLRKEIKKNVIGSRQMEPNPTLTGVLTERIHALTFCPGKVILGPVKRLKIEQMMEAYQTSVLDAFVVIQSLLPRLEGSVTLLSSVAARSGLPNHCAISAAKSALEGFAIALAADLAPKVRVNVVAPTLTPTEMGTAMVGGEKCFR